jgi:hypothetical protein
MGKLASTKPAGAVIYTHNHARPSIRSSTSSRHDGMNDLHGERISTGVRMRAPLDGT